MKSSRLSIACSDVIQVFDWDGSTLKRNLAFKPIKTKNSKVNDIKWNHNNMVLLSCCNDTISLNKYTNGKNLGQMTTSSQSLNSLALSKGSRYLVTGGKDSIVYIIDLKQKEIVKSFTGHSSPISKVCFSNNDQCITSASSNGELFQYEVNSNKRISLINCDSNITDLKYSYFSKQVCATTEENGIVSIFDMKRSKRILDYKNHTKQSKGLHFCKEYENSLFSVGSDQLLILYDIRQKKPHTIIETGKDLNSISFANGNIAIGTSSGEILMYDLRREPFPICFNLVQDIEPINCICFSNYIPKPDLLNWNDRFKVIEEKPEEKKEEIPQHQEKQNQNENSEVQVENENLEFQVENETKHFQTKEKIDSPIKEIKKNTIEDKKEDKLKTSIEEIEALLNQSKIEKKRKPIKAPIEIPNKSFAQPRIQKNENIEKPIQNETIIALSKEISTINKKVDDLKSSVNGKIRNLHLDILKGFHNQQEELTNSVNAVNQKLDYLIKLIEKNNLTI